MKRYLIIFYSIVYASVSLFAADEPPKKTLITFSSDATKEDKQQIFIMDIDGDGVKQVAHIKGLDCYGPKFSPDGRKIIFNATNKISDFLYMIDLDDSSTFKFPKFIDGGIDPQFSQDGFYLLYRSEKLEDNALYIMDLTTDSSITINDGSLSTQAEYSSDGSKIIYTSSLNQNFDLVVLDLNDTTDNAQKTIVATKDAELYGTFSPDDKMIAYASFDINYKGTVWVCNVDGKNKIQISKGLGSSYNPKFSPDGKKFTFISDKGGKMQLFICNVDGSGVKQLISTSGSTVEYDWAHDSKSIVYEIMSESVSSINILNLETNKSENLTGSNANNINPNFQPDTK